MVLFADMDRVGSWWCSLGGRLSILQKLHLNDVACYKSFIWETYDLIVVLLVLGDALLCKDWWCLYMLRPKLSHTIPFHSPCKFWILKQATWDYKHMVLGWCNRMVFLMYTHPEELSGLLYYEMLMSHSQSRKWYECSRVKQFWRGKSELQHILSHLLSNNQKPSPVRYPHQCGYLGPRWS